MKNLRFQLVFALLSCIAFAPSLIGQKSPNAARDTADASAGSKIEAWELRQQLESKFTASMDVILAKCREQKLIEAENSLKAFTIPRDPERQYIFLPSENVIDEHPLLPDLPDNLREEIEATLADHADALYELATSEAKKENATFAYKLLHEVLFFAPNHKRVREVLGHRINLDANTWRVKPDRLNTRKSTKPNRELNWSAKSYLIASTTHFRIVSRASEEDTRYLAQQLETWHDVWRQVFFEYHNRPINLNRWLNGSSKPTPSRRKYSVVFFANQQEYVAQLQDSIPGIAASTGFYNDGEKASYFYASKDTTIQDTWRHELTHQLFQESRQSVRSPFDERFLWLGEGIAMYFESLVDHGNYFTVGGFDSRRLQYARLRRMKEQFLVPIEQLSNWSRRQFQSSRDIAKIYSQSAGITHYLIDAEHGSMRQPLIEFFRLSYRGRLKTGTFEKLIGKSFAELEQGYDHFLKIDANELKFLTAPQTRRELELIGMRLEHDSLKPLSKCEQLVWLGLSGCDVRGPRLSPLLQCRKLEQLFLTGALFDEKAAVQLAATGIKEIDLSGAQIPTEAFSILAKSKTLETINLSATSLLDEQLLELGQMKSLKSLSVGQTQVSGAGVRQFRANRPDVELTVQ